jgi:hypothetical protein
MFWVANKINSWFHRATWKSWTLLAFTLSFFVVPVILSFFIHTSQFKIIMSILGAVSMVLNMYLVIYVRTMCYDMNDRRVKKFFHNRWLRTPEKTFMYLSFVGRSNCYSSFVYGKSWDMEEVLYVPSDEIVKYYERVVFHPFAFYPLQPVSKKDIKKYDLEVKMAKAFLGGAEPE